MKTILIKIGGLVAQDDDALGALLQEIRTLGREQAFALVHGGGKEVTAVSEKFGYQAEFQNGVRMTSPGEMEVVDMVLGGKLNISLVRRAQALGLKAVGLGGQDGGLFLSRALTAKPEGRTGEVLSVDPALIELLLGAGYLPILHSTSMDAEGRGLNINADEAAQAVAMGLKAERLVYISDIPGVLKDGQVLPSLDATRIAEEIAVGVISGGMVPKVKNALSAVKAGVGAVVIGGYHSPGDLGRLLAGNAGTTIQN